MTAETVRLHIEGMGCDGCVAAVEDALRKVPGVRRVTVDLAGAAADVELEGPMDSAPLLAAIDEAGYVASLA